MKTLKYTSTLIAVADMEKSKQFYQNLMLLSLQGLAIVSSDDMTSVAVLVKEL